MDSFEERPDAGPQRFVSRMMSSESDNAGLNWIRLTRVVNSIGQDCSYAIRRDQQPLVTKRQTFLAMHGFVPLVFLLFLPAFPLVAQNPPNASNSGITSPDGVHTGVVVEKLTHGAAADVAGLKEGDLVLVWSRQDRTGNIESPFDLTTIETEEAPRGEVKLQGERGSEKQSWTLSSGPWGIETRPNFSLNALGVYASTLETAEAGKPREAAKLLAELAEKRKGLEPFWVSAWLFLRSAEMAAAAKDPETDHLYEEAIKQATDHEPAVLQFVLTERANSCLERRDLVNAEKYYRLALAAAQKTGAEKLSAAATLDHLGSIARSQDDLTAAEHYYQESLAIRNKLSPGSSLVADSLNNLGVTAALGSQLTRAESYLLQALAIREKLDPDGRFVAATLMNLGSVYRYLGDLAKAASYLQHAEAIWRRLAPDSVGLARTLNNLGDVARERGDLKQAEEYLTQALAIKRKILPGSLDVTSTLDNLAVVFSNRGDLNKAEAYYRESLSIQERIAPNSLGVAGTLANLGQLASQRGDLGRSEEWLKRALTITEKLAPESLQAATALINLGDVEVARGDTRNPPALPAKSLISASSVISGETRLWFSRGLPKARRGGLPGAVFPAIDAGCNTVTDVGAHQKPTGFIRQIPDQRQQRNQR